MCFSANASLASGILLFPIGAYCLTAALRKNFRYVPLALTPLLFGVQQFCEAYVWIGLEENDPALVKRAALAFLFFAVAFWPCWIPFVTAVVDPRPGKRRLFFGLAGIGLAVGGAYYVAAALYYDEWLVVGVANHAIRYDLSRMPLGQAAASVVWQGVYLALVCVPLLMSRERRLGALGISIALAAAITHVVFRYAFASIWCFFAAVLSAQICYVLSRLPNLIVPRAAG